MAFVLPSALEVISRYIVQVDVVAGKLRTRRYILTRAI